MKKTIVLMAVAMFVTLLAGCTLDYRDPGYGPSGPTVYTEYPDTPYIEVEVAAGYYYDDGCWGEPYYHTPEWCDWYDDGTTCCVWWVEDSYYDGWSGEYHYDGWYEEYCQWEDDYCWEYSGSF